MSHRAPITKLAGLTADLISVTEAAKLSGFTTGFIRQLLIRREIDGVKIGRNWLTTREAIEEYLKRDRRRGPKPKGKQR